MPRWTDLSLRTRLVVPLGLLAVLTVAVAATAGVVALRDHFEEQARDKLNATTERIRGAVRTLDEGLTLTPAGLRRFTGDGDAGASVVIVADGEPIAWVGVGPTEADALVAEIVPGEPQEVPGEPQLLATAIDTEGIGLRMRVAGQTSDVDSIVVAADTRDDVVAVRESVRGAVVTGLVLIALTLALTAWIVTRGLRPLRDMADAAQRVAAGDRRTRLAEPRGDPSIRRVAHTVNAALDAQVAAEQRVRDFVADASHELRTPLTSAAGWVEFYQQGGLEDRAARDEAFDRVAQQLGRMRSLVDDLATIARLDGGVPLGEEPVDLVTLCREAVDDAAVLAPDRAVTLTGVDSAPAVGDGGRLLQVVRNLVSNSCRHTPAGGSVVVTVREAGDGWQVVVTDEGPGIAPADLPHLFERFWRAEGSRSRDTGGSGLGLAISRAIAEAHGGRLEATSVVGQGTTMTVTLPRRTSSADRQA